MIACIAPSPDAKRIYHVGPWTPGSVIRARNTETRLSGKGVNAARAAAALGSTVQCILPLPFVPDPEQSDRLIWTAVPIAGPLRSCITILDNEGIATELVEEPFPLSDAEAASYIDACLTAVETASLLICAGSLPPGLPEDLYATLVLRAKRRGIPSVVDCHGLSLVRVVESGPTLLKITEEELRASFDAGEDLSPVLAHLARQMGGWIVTTSGPGPVRGAGPFSESLHLHPPTLRVVNPIGAGDAMSGALASLMEQGHEIPSAVEIAMNHASRVATLPLGQR